MEKEPLATRPKITVEQLDKLMSWAEKDPSSKLEMVFSLLQLLAVLAYLWARARLEESDWERKKHESARDAKSADRAEIDEESMDGK
jgi:hypothetical protein